VHFRIFHQMLGLFLGHTQFLNRRKKLLEVQTGRKNSENSRAVVCGEWFAALGWNISFAHSLFSC